jgi:hypothetical protein
MTPPAKTHADRFVGRWVGQTQGWVSAAHVWEIVKVNERTLRITTRWEDGRRIDSFQASVLADEPAFVIRDLRRHFKAELVDSQHFLIPGWDTNDARGGEGPDYDVVFSRPGLAELTAGDVWRRHRRPEAGT